MPRAGGGATDPLGLNCWGRQGEGVERTQAWVVAFRRLAIRYDRQATSVLACLHLARALICRRYLAHAEAEAH